MLLFNGNQRSPIQALGGDDYCHWLIHPIKNDKEIIVSRILDERHFSGDKKLDADARKERRHELKKRSHKQAKEGVARESKARQELSEATSEYLLSLGEAVNDA
jgi:hypothetical protein